MLELDAGYYARYWERRLILIALVLGGLATAYMTYESARYLQGGDTGPRLCSFSKWINCDASVSSPYAFVLGVPIAWIALLFFVSIGFLLKLAKRSTKYATSTVAVAMTLCVVASAVSVCMLALLLLKINAICLPCLLIQSASFILCVITVRVFRRHVPSIQWPFVLVLLVMVHAFYGEGIAAFLQVKARFLAPRPVNVALELRNHFSKPRVIGSSALRSAIGEEPNDEVQIVCFLDYQCPACKRFASLLPMWLGDMKERCRVIKLQFPLDASVNPYKPNGKHLQAGLAAKAAICFQQLGIAETMESRMFQCQPDLGLPTLLMLALNAGVNTNRFLQMIESGNTKDILMRHLELAHAAGVSATPTVFIDGRRVRCFYEPEVIRGIIAAELNRPVHVSLR